MRTERQSTATKIWIGQIAALLLAAMVMGGAAVITQPIDRSDLTQSLVPITGEKTRSLDLTVPFARNSARLTKTARRQLNELAAALSGDALRAFPVEVYGHTDASGPAGYNLKLSRARAAETVRYLVEKRGLSRKRFRHEGYGEERLLVGVSPGSPRHRRVEVVVINQSIIPPEKTDTRAVEEDKAKRGANDDEKTRNERGGFRPIQ